MDILEVFNKLGVAEISNLIGIHGRAYVITPDGVAKEVEPKDMRDQQFTLEEVQKHIGVDTLEWVRRGMMMPTAYHMIVDEMAHMRQDKPEYNAVATYIYGSGHPILGTVLLCPRRMFE